MPLNLLAICRANNQLSLKRVATSADVQALLEGVFTQQEQEFLADITDEVVFDGGWKPEPNEILVVAATQEVETIFVSAQEEVIGLAPVNPAAFGAEGIRALAAVVTRPGGPRLLLQTFDPRQLLQNRVALFLNGETFNRLTAPAFSVGTSLSGIVENGQVKFRSYSKIRQIFELQHLYVEATDAQVNAFTGHASIAVNNGEEFRANADQGIRKLINAVSHRGTLDLHAVGDIRDAAAGEGLVIELANGRMVLPMERQAAKRMLAFLDDGYYRAALSGLRYITNSKRQIP